VRCFAAAIFAAIGLFAGAVGTHDAYRGLEVASRIGGMLLLVAGLLLVSTAVALFLPKLKWATTAGICVSPVGAAVGLSLVGAQLASPDGNWVPVALAGLLVVVLVVLGVKFEMGSFELAMVALWALFIAYGILAVGDNDERLVFWVAMTIGSGLAAYALWNAAPPDLSAPASRIVELVFGVFTLGAVVAALQFWYTSQYVPASLGASLSVHQQLERIPGTGPGVVRLTLTVENTGQTQVKILGSVYRVAGSPTQPAERDEGALSSQLRLSRFEDRTVSRFRREASWDLVQVGHVFAGLSWLDPDEEYSTSVLVYVPPGRYDALRSQAQLLISKGGALSTDLFGPGPKPLGRTDPREGFVTEWPIHETSWFRELTRAERRLQVIWVTGAKGPVKGEARYPYIESVVYRVGSEEDQTDFTRYTERVLTLYGLAESVSSMEMPLPPARRRSRSQQGQLP
jgi:hypothetical protein